MTKLASTVVGFNTGFSLDALAAFETSSIARGYKALDDVSKRAQVAVQFADALTPGKFVVVFAGDVAAVEESFEAGLSACGDCLVDSVHLPLAHSRLLSAIRAGPSSLNIDACIVVECTTVSSTILAADTALKATATDIARFHLADGIGGKGFFVLTGALSDVEAASEVITSALAPERLVAVELISQPHDEIRGFLEPRASRLFR